MRVTRTSTSLTCDVCERSLLMGERAVRFQPHPGAEVFNASDHRRAVAGIARSLGLPHVSIVPSRARVSGELVITIAWDLSWYQYRVAPESSQPVRLESRGQDPGELDRRYTAWNAHLEEDGRV